MDTSFSVKEIQTMLANSPMFCNQGNIIVPNVSFGLLNHEADLIVISKSGYLSEIEIKRSWSDFKADFKKPHSHQDERVHRFYFAVPASIEERVVGYIRSNKIALDGVIVYFEDKTHKIIPGSKMGVYFSGGRKLFIEEMLTAARLGCLRLWRENNLYIRFGEIPEDERSGTYWRGERKPGCLDGVSCYECTPDRKLVFPSPMTEHTADTFYGFFAYGKQNRPVYLVKGDRVGTGPDGEPLIRNVEIVEELKEFYPKSYRE